MAWYEERCGEVRGEMSGLSEDKSRTSEASWRTVTNQDPRMEMGADFHGFRSWIA